MKRKRKQRSDEPRVLVLRRYKPGSTVGVVRGSTRTTADCGHECWIAPTGAVFIAANESLLTICFDCVPEGELDVRAVPGSRDELAKHVGTAAADQVLAAARELGKQGRMRGKQ